jgi:antitoxin (DNA-binding transcriptional repressor) of toxin-antitoxin stability system
MQTVNIHEAKTQFSRLVDVAAGGEEIVIAKVGKALGARARNSRQPRTKEIRKGYGSPLSTL